jgi:hypothetical protein
VPPFARTVPVPIEPAVAFERFAGLPEHWFAVSRGLRSRKELQGRMQLGPLAWPARIRVGDPWLAESEIRRRLEVTFRTAETGRPFLELTGHLKLIARSTGGVRLNYEGEGHLPRGVLGILGYCLVRTAVRAITTQVAVALGDNDVTQTEDA